MFRYIKGAVQTESGSNQQNKSLEYIPLKLNHTSKTHPQSAVHNNRLVCFEWVFFHFTISFHLYTLVI